MGAITNREWRQHYHAERLRTDAEEGNERPEAHQNVVVYVAQELVRIGMTENQ